ncbi:hypothetical protein BC826DRAFT_1059998 [Russula brevipes]|nr:hypothetical protein BC826DRAFT_1059998 [Russula brevipes]
MVTFWVFLGCWCWCWRVGGMVGPFSASNDSLLSGAGYISIVTILSVAGLTTVLHTAQVT